MKCEGESVKRRRGRRRKSRGYRRIIYRHRINGMWRLKGL
jgi:hypothetical protein